MTRAAKQRRRPTTTTSPRSSPPDKQAKRLRHNTLANFLALAPSDNESEATSSEHFVAKHPSDSGTKDAVETEVQGLRPERVEETPREDEKEKMTDDPHNEDFPITEGDPEQDAKLSKTILQLTPLRDEPVQGPPSDDNSADTVPTGRYDALPTKPTPPSLAGLSDDSRTTTSNDTGASLEVTQSPTPDQVRGRPVERTTFRLIPARPYTVRYSLQLHLNTSTPTDETVIDSIRKFLTQVRSVDPTAIIYPWMDQTNGLNPITSPTTVPNSVQRLRQYFPRLTSRTRAGEVHTTIRLGTSISQENLRDRLGTWLQGNRFGLWPCQLQTAQTKCLGWLLYSVRELDLAMLTEAIIRQSRFHVGLRWRPIATGKATPTNNQERTRAVHLEVAAEDYTPANEYFRQLYSAAASGPFPNGIRMRIVPEIGPHMTILLRSKVERLRLHQAHFTQATVKVANWEIEALDFRDKTTGQSLREVLVQIKSNSHPHVNLIHSVDRFWNGNGHVFTIIPLVESEAKMIISGLLPYLRATQGAFQSDRYFTAAAIERANEASWDVNQHGLITADDQFIQAILSEDETFDLGIDRAQSSTTQAVLTSTLTPDPRHGPNLMDGDTDSVSTLHTAHASQKMPGKPTQWRNPTSIAHENQVFRQSSPQTSTVSSLTVEEIIIITQRLK